MLASFTIQTLNGLASASLLFLVALGLTLIFGVTRVVNFAHGSLAMLGAYLAVTFNAKLGGGGLGFWAGGLLAALLVAALGALIEVLILRRIYVAPELLQLIATFGIVLVVKDAVLYLWGPEDLIGPRVPGLQGAVTLLGRPFPAYDLLLLALGPLFLLLVWLLLKHTHFGTKVRAATEDREMVAALGVDQARLFTSVFALGSFLAGIGGALALPREPANLGMDLSIITDAFVVTVIGGLGSIPGAYLAAAVIGIVKAWCIGIGDVTWLGWSLSFPKLTLVVEFLVMAVVLILKPWGLFGRPPVMQRAQTVLSYAIPSPTRQLRHAVALAVVLLAALPLVADRYTVVLMTDVAVFALFAASLGLLMGSGGMASFGHAAYFGAGAYAAAVAAKSGMAFLVAIAAGFAFAGTLAIVFGWFAVRSAGVSFAMLTLAFAQISWAIAFQWDAVTGGSNGLIGVWPPPLLTSKTHYFWFTLVVLGTAILFAWRVVHSSFGYQLRAARDSPARAETLGIDVRRLQWIAFIIAGALAGLAGAVLAFSKGSLSPDALSIPRSLDALVMVLLGGVTTLTGPVIGAAVFTVLQDWLARATPYWHAVLGLTVIAITVLFPQGIVGTLRQRFSRLRGGL